MLQGGKRSDEWTIVDVVKRWTAKRKSALVIEIIQGKTTAPEASRSYDLSRSEIEGWVNDVRRGMENALRANRLDVRQQYEKQLRDLQEASTAASALENALIVRFGTLGRVPE